MSRVVLALQPVLDPGGRPVRVAWAVSVDKLDSWLASQRAPETWRRDDDPPGVRRFFKRGGPLEDFLPPWEADPRCLTEVPELREHLVIAGRQWRELFEKLPQVGEPEEKKP